MALTRIKTNNILDREVRSQDLADGAVTFDKILVTDVGNPGDVLTVDAFGNLLFAPASGTAATLGALADVNVAGVIDEQVLQYDAGALEWVPVTIPGLGSSSNTFVVNNLASLPATPSEGDTMLVRSGADGEYKFYVKDTITTDAASLTFNGSSVITRTGGASDFVTEGFADKQVISISGTTNNNGGYSIVNVTPTTITVAQSTVAEGPVAATLSGSWILLATEDSARTDANTSEAIVLFNTGSPVLIGNVSKGSRVTTVTVEVTTAFTGGGTPVLTVGDAGDNARLMQDVWVDLAEVGTYVVNADYVYTGTTDTDVLAYFDFAGSTQGAARVIVTHV